MQTHGRNIINWPRGKTHTNFHKLSQTNCKFILKTVDKFKGFFFSTEREKKKKNMLNEAFLLVMQMGSSPLEVVSIHFYSLADYG